LLNSLILFSIPRYYFLTITMVDTCKTLREKTTIILDSTSIINPIDNKDSTVNVIDQFSICSNLFGCFLIFIF
jgi:hypothetical protein